MLESNVFIRFILKLNEFRTYRRVSKFMVLTPNYRDYLVRLGGAVERMELLNFPLDTNKFSPRKMSKGEQQKVMLKLGIPRTFLRFPIMMFVGNFYSWGGLVEFLVEVSKHPQKSRFKVILVGDGPARDQINEVIKKYQLKSIVHITGYIQFDEIPNCIRVADVCFNVWPINKRTNEVFSAKIIQYLACGKPVITSNLSGIRRALDSSAGVIYKDSISGVLDGAVEMLADLHKCELLGKVGRKYVLKNHSINNVVSKVNLEAWHLNNIRELGKYAI
jgi:glycosyltransferase involved in cell wall biosynthesis